MKIVYVANMRLPTEKAHGVQIMKMCEAFAKEGADVELLVPRRRTPIKEDPFDYYWVERVFTVRRLPTLDIIGIIPRVGLWIESVVFSFFVVLHLRGKKIDAVYSRDNIPLFFLSFIYDNLWWEPHVGSWNFVARRVLKKVEGVISITEGGKDYFMRCGIAEEDIMVAHDGVDLAQFDVKTTIKEARERLGLPLDKRIAMYIGLFDSWKGYFVLLNAAKELAKENIFVAMIGGTDGQVVKLKKEYPHVFFTGYRPYTELPSNQKAADVLVIPNSAKSDVSTIFTSPLKLFSYMVSGKPIVASNIPTLREVLENDKNARLVEPDNSWALVDGIKSVLSDRSLANKISSQAFDDARKYAWQKRAEKILSFMRL